MPVNTGSGTSGKGATPQKIWTPFSQKIHYRFFCKSQNSFEQRPSIQKKTFGRSQEFFWSVTGAKSDFGVGGVWPPKGDPESRLMAAFCRD